MQSITLDGKQYEILDVIEKITLADSFVARPNKMGAGNGEAKLYVGNEGELLRNFFGAIGFHADCFMLKEDLLKYFNQMKPEYFNPAQEYKNSSVTDLKGLWQKRNEYLMSLPDVLWFTIGEKDHLKPPRVYVQSDHAYYQLLRDLPLPNTSYLSVLKLRDSSSFNNSVYYLRLFADYDFGEGHTSESVISDVLDIVEAPKLSNFREQSTRVRVGQAEYRKKLLLECPVCPVTMVSDERLLIASHIKPHAKSTPQEQIDPKNGFMFTPTYDKLFDKGFITFLDDRRMLVSPFLSPHTQRLLGLVNLKSITQLPVDGRQKYMDYHRANLFQGNLRDY